MILISLMLTQWGVIRNVYSLLQKHYTLEQSQKLLSMGRTVVERHKSDMERVLHRFSHDPQLADIFEDHHYRQEVVSQWEFIRSLFPNRAWIYYGDVENRIIVSPQWIPPDDYDLRTRPWYTEAMNGGGAVWPEPFIDVVTGKYVLTVAIKIVDSTGEVRGVFAIDTFISDFLDLLISQTGEQSTPMFIITGEGEIIGNHAFPLAVEELKSSAQWESIIYQSSNGFFETEEGNWFISTVDLPDLGFVLGSMVSEESFKKDSIVIHRTLLNTAIVSMVLALCCAWLLSKYISDNVENLFKYTKKVVSENYPLSICVTGKDEIFHLNESINQLVDSLRSKGKQVQQLNDQLKEQVIRDNLTGIYNRYYWNEVVPKILERAQRDKTKLSIIIIDIDHFKRVNDTFGHHTGDRFLEIISQLISDNIRTGDIFCRLGGEEFSLLIEHLEEEQVFILAEKLRLLIEMSPIQTEQIKHHITISLGIAHLPPHGEAMDELIKQADTALYDAKNNGRNRIAVYKRRG